MSRQYKVMVMGSGFGIHGHVPVLQDHPSFLLDGLIGSTSNSRGREIAESMGVAYYQGLENMLSNKDPKAVDLVVVATPPYQHFESIIKVLDHGIHVLAEKPLGANALEAAKMVMAAKAAGRYGWINFEFRMVPARRKLQQLMELSRHGKTLSFYWILGGSGYEAYTNRFVGWNTDSNLGGGYLGALGSHLIDYLISLFGMVTSVQAQKVIDVVARRNGINRADDGFSVIFTFESGVSGVLHYRSASRKKIGSVLEITGTSGGFRMVNDRDVDEFDAEGRLTRVEYEEQTQHGIRRSSDPVYRATWEIYTAIANHLDDSEQTMLPTFEDGLKVQRVMDAIERSHQMGIRCGL